MAQKLYTEEQVREMLKSTHIHTDNDVNMILPQFKPIELPSDGEIIEVSHNIKYTQFNPFANGAIWMRDKIQGGKQ